MEILLVVLLVYAKLVNADLEDDILAATPLHPTFKIADVFAQQEDQLKFEAVANFTGTFWPYEECSVNKTDLQLGDYGVIKTPNYPRNYPGRTSCEWYFESPPGTRIQATIYDLFTQPWFFTYFDYVMISKTGNFSKVDRMAGDLNTKTPLTITSKDNKFGVRFKSSTIFNFRGMKINYLVRPVEWDTTDQKVYPQPNNGVCGTSTLLDNHELTVATTTLTSGILETSTVESIINSTTGHTDDYIIGPDNASRGSFPWMAALLIDGRSFCGGSLIDDQHILTAAHCTDGARKVTVLLGALDIKDKSETGRMAFNITREHIFQHPDYNPLTITHDITVIKLPQKVQFTENIKPICLPNRYYLDKTFVGEEVRVSGWGKTSDNQAGVSPVLKNTTVNVMSNGLCRAFFRSIVTGNLICIGTKFDASPCRGDSGGPLILKQADPTSGQQYFMQVGIVSFGGNSCQRGFPVGFTRVTAFLDYISSVTSMTL